jgi:hypothetical protein
VLFGLAKFILPWLGDEVRIYDLTFGYFVLMFCSHVAARYGKSSLSRSRIWGLAPWQRRHVMELVDAELAPATSAVHPGGGMPSVGEQFFPFLQTVLRYTGTSLCDPLSSGIRQVSLDGLIDAPCRNCAPIRIQRSVGVQSRIWRHSRNITKTMAQRAHVRPLLPPRGGRRVMTIGDSGWPRRHPP